MMPSPSSSSNNPLKDRRLKWVLATLVLGFLNIILMSTVYLPDVRDGLYLSVVCTCFIISLLYVILLKFSCIQSDRPFIVYCEAFHLFAAALLFGESIQFVISTVHILKYHVCIGGCVFYFIRRFCVVFIGFLSFIAYGVAGLMLLDFRIRPRPGVGVRNCDLRV